MCSHSDDNCNTNSFELLSTTKICGEYLNFVYFKVFWSSENRSFVFNQIFVYGTLMGVDYKSEKEI